MNGVAAYTGHAAEAAAASQRLPPASLRELGHGVERGRPPEMVLPTPRVEG
jgi:hypothetical protein